MQPYLSSFYLLFYSTLITLIKFVRLCMYNTLMMILLVNFVYKNL